MGFEYSVIMAWITNRTLVMPPTTGWYLIDWGPLARMKTEDTSQVSSFGDFFDMSDLAKLVPIMTTAEFIDKFKEDLLIPEKFWNIDTWRKRQDWKKYLNELGKEREANMKWGPGGHFLAVPDIKTVKKERRPEDTFIAHREYVE